MAPSTASPQLSSLCLAPPFCLTILTGGTGRLICATGVFITAPVQVGEEQEEELLPPPRPGSSAAAAGSSDGKPPPKTFLPLEDDEDDTGIIPDEEQIRCMLKTHRMRTRPLADFAACLPSMELTPGFAVDSLLSTVVPRVFWCTCTAEKHCNEVSCAGEHERRGSECAARIMRQTTCPWRAAMERPAPKTHMLS